MFGESESESPRVPSPWDNLISTPSSPCSGTPLRSVSSTSISFPSPSRLSCSSPDSYSATSPSSSLSVKTLSTTATKAIDGLQVPIPKLVPEIEEGNVEYKLQLLNPSPARFARLVTQMRWRLLEGGGQAYYELGVADSGALIGLPRIELERSLETLEMMAGEIGASVVVVKEIEVPAAFAGLASSMTDHWNAKRNKILIGAENPDDGGQTNGASGSDSPGSSSREFDRGTDFDEEDSGDGAFTSSSVEKDYRFVYPGGSPPTSENEDANAADRPLIANLKISSVFKPRPTRCRPEGTAASGVKIGKFAMGQKKKLLKVQHPGLADGENKQANEEGEGQTQTQTQTKQQAKAINRRQARDRKRELKRRALVSQSFSHVGNQEVPADPLVGSSEAGAVERVPEKDGIEEMTNELGELHVPIAVEPPRGPSSSSSSSALHEPSVSLDATFALSEFERSSVSSRGTTLRIEDDETGDDIDIFPSHSNSANDHFLTVPSPTTASTTRVTANGRERGEEEARLIVEALVVRKMSLEESFLDFGGFSLS